jgi:hypothetical protein
VTGNQGAFSSSYTAWLADKFDSQDVRDYFLNEHGVDVGDPSLWNIDIAQNSPTAVPWITNLGLTQADFEILFENSTKVTFSWSVGGGKNIVTHNRYYFDEFDFTYGGDPWGDNPLVLHANASGQPGDPGGDGTNGDDGTPGEDGADAVGTGTNGANAVPGQGTAAVAGGKGPDGENGTNGAPGEDGTNGEDGLDGQSAIEVDQDAEFTAILVDATSGPVVILGGDGGAGGAGGAGGHGGDGGAGGDGGDGGAGGDGGGMASQGVRQGAPGGDGGDGGDGGSGGAGGNGGDGGNGGNGAHAIINGSLSEVYIVGSHAVTILGGTGGTGGAAGADGTVGAGGEGGEGGTGGAGGTSSGGLGNGASGSAGANGEDGQSGNTGSAGASGSNGSDAPAFSDPVIVYANLSGANAFTGHLTISGSNSSDTMYFGSGGTAVYGTVGDDTYHFGAGEDIIIYTAFLQSSGSDTIYNFDPDMDKLDFSALSSGGTYSWDGEVLEVDFDGGGVDMSIKLVGLGEGDLNGANFLWAV